MEAGRDGLSPDLMTLLEIQDLTSKMRELEGGLEFQQLEKEHFHIDAEEAVRQLAEKVAELEEQLDPRIRRRYGRIAGRLDRVVVPVINAVCYGCFTSIATSVAIEQALRGDVHTCENCGRFIYFLP